MVVVGPYFMSVNRDPESPYNKGGIEAAKEYNRITGKCAEDNGILFADVFNMISQAPWVVDTDNVHLNDLGHMAVACRIFETLAANCSCLSIKAYRAAQVRPSWRDETHLSNYDGI
jgi:lysophospholipase L1-like esterase